MKIEQLRDMVVIVEDGDAMQARVMVRPEVIIPGFRDVEVCLRGSKPLGCRRQRRAHLPNVEGRAVVGAQHLDKPVGVGVGTG